jgi:8-oxo-dGTP pyrophosphatase MutT (NUDIX family)
VVVLRDGGGGLEVLLLERGTREPGRPGFSVFPGGSVEEADRCDEPDDELACARRAAARETREEAGLVLRPEALVPISRWITPDASPRRFDACFFAVETSRETVVRVDGEEIVRHRWLLPEEALETRLRGELRLAPPTFVTVHWLLGFGSAKDALEQLGRGPLLTIRPRICQHQGAACVLYPGDAGYDAGDPQRPGPRHRLWMGSGFEAWRYERD